MSMTLPIDQELIDPQASNCEQPNINCVGDAVPDYQLLSCATGELTSAHSLMDQEGKGTLDGAHPPVGAQHVAIISHKFVKMNQASPETE